MPRTKTVLIAFLAHALAGGGIFARIPDIQAGLALDEATLGLALTVAATGGLAANLFAGRVIGLAGTRPILLVGIPAMATLTAAAALAPSVPLLFIALFANGIAFALANVAMNVEADRVEAATGRKVMNRCHGVWSAGMLTTSLVGVGARAVPVSAALHLSLMVPVALAVAAIWLYPMSAAPRAPDDKSDRRGFALPSGRTLTVVLFGLSGGIAQSATQNWSVIFMRDSFAAPDWVDTLTLPAFLVAMTLGRIFADGWTMRFGPVRVVVILTLLAIAGALMVALSPTPPIALLGFAALGTGTAALFPLMVTAAARSPNRPAAEAVSAAIMTTSAMMMAAPALMGWVAELWGVRAAFWTLMLPLLVTLSLCHVAGPRRASPAPEPA